MFMLSHLDGFGGAEAGGNDAFTKVLLHMEGVDGGTSFLDSSSLASSFTAAGNAQTHSTSFSTPKFGTSSGKFDGTTDYISCPNNAALLPAAGDLTVDFWIRYNAGSIFQTLFDKGYTNANGLLIQTDNSASPKINIYLGGVLILAETTGTATGALTHKAIVRASGTFTIYSNGVANGSAAGATTITDTSALCIGAQFTTGGNAFNGNLDEYRFSVGVARWTAAFTPPASPYS